MAPEQVHVVSEPDQRAQAIAFLRDTDRAVAGEVHTLTVRDGDGAVLPARAWAVLDAARPLVWDANYVWVQDTGGADADALSRVAEAALGAAGLDHRLLVVADPGQALAVAGQFRAKGWQERPNVIMVHREPERLVEPAAARELSAQTALAARRAMIVEEPWGSPTVAEQILSRDALIEQAAAGRCFGVQVGGAVVCHCQLFARDGVAQVENVGTQLTHRNRGLAKAVVSLATAVGRESAALVFLCADAHDWPQHLYRRLGYEPVGLLHRFCPTLPAQLSSRA